MNTLLPSYHQERLWFIDKFESNYLYESSPVYHNVPLVIRVTGQLDVAALNKSIGTVIERHESLRTQIVSEHDKPVPIIHTSIHFELFVKQLPSGTNESLINDLICREVQLPFILNEDLLLRGTLFEVHTQEYFVVLVFHHLIIDRYSLKIFTQELFNIYSSIINKETLSLPKPEIGYSDFALWQKEMNAKSLKPLLFYWKGKLGSKIQALDLPTDRIRQGIHIFEEENNCFSFSPLLAKKIKAYSQAKQANIQDLILTAFKITLHRYSYQEEIVIGTSFNNRNQPGTSNVIGPLANLIVLKTFFSKDSTFEDLRAEISNNLAEAAYYQDLPFDKLVQELNPDKDMSRTALFDVLFQYDQTLDNVFQIGNSQFQVKDNNSGWGKYDLNFLVQERGDSFAGIITYNKLYYKAETINRLLASFYIILDTVLDSPHISVNSFSIVSDEERHVILNQQDISLIDFPKLCLHELFEQQVLIHPNKTALVFEGKTLSYTELNEVANQLAFYLKTNYNIKANDLCAILLDRSEWMIVTVLAIMKAGGAYVPIDPEYPQSRVDFIIKDCGCHVVLNEEELQKFRADSSFYPVSNIQSGNKPTDLVYVIYTSGTTGTPKGVLIEHQNVVSLLKNQPSLFNFSSEDTWTMFHSYCFDFSVWEMYGALLNGGKLVVVPKLTAQDTSAFVELLVSQKVTVLNQTPSAFYNLAAYEMGHPKPDLSLRYVIFGGEALSPGRLKEWIYRHPDTLMINMYGITETTVHVTYKEIRESEVETDTANIGRPIPTLTSYVIDENGFLVPLGIPGELCVGGFGVSRGYLNRKELTDLRFIDNLFKEGERIYRSGDKARMLANGELEYLGRIDDQVKIRGFRIELGEIEHALRNFTEVDHAIVMARKNHAAESELVAYLVGSKNLNVSDVRSYLMNVLPGYMVPSYFIQLDKMPLTANGKVDKKMLPNIAGESLNLGVQYVAPTNAKERLLLELWADYFKLAYDRIGIDDSFFSLGGNSLKAIQLIFSISNRFNQKLSIAQIFTHSTVRQMATLLDLDNKNAVNPIKPAPLSDYYPLSNAQLRLYLLYQMDKASIAYNMPVLFVVKGKLDVDRLEAAFNKLIERHEIFRTAYLNVKGEFVQQLTGEIKFVVNRSIIEFANSINELVYEFVQPFDLATPPLIRAQVFEVKDTDESIFFFDMPHIISDGISSRIIISDLVDFYSGKNKELPKIHYKDYAFYLQNEGAALLKEQEKYWLEKFRSMPDVTGLPVDHERLATIANDGERVQFKLEAEHYKRVNELGHQTESTPFTVLLSAYFILLAKYSDKQHVVVGTPVAGRTNPDVMEIVGMFANTLALSYKFENGMSYMDYLTNLKKQLADDFSNQDYPFDELVNRLPVSRTNENPFFDTMFVFQNFEEQIIELDGLSFSTVPQNKVSSKFDLSFIWTEVNGAFSCTVEYRTQLFKGTTVKRFFKHYERILSQVLGNTAIPISEIELMSPEEKEQLVNLSNISTEDSYDF